MLKRLLVILLSIMMTASVFAGCTLVERDDFAVEAQTVAVIEPIKFGDYETKRIVITRKDVKDFFEAQNAGQFIQNGATAEEILEYYVPEMVNNELILLEGQRMFDQGEMKKYTVYDTPADKVAGQNGHTAPYTQSEYNAAWQQAYVALDADLFELMTDIASSHGWDAPVRIENGDGKTEPPYAVPETEKEEGAAEQEEPWLPVSVYGTDADDAKLLKLAAKQLIKETIDEYGKNPYLLDEEDKASLEADTKRYNEIKNCALNDEKIESLYADLRGYHVVREKYFDAQEDNLMYMAIQNAVMGQFVTKAEYDAMTEEERKGKEFVTPEEVQKKYDSLYTTQKNTFQNKDSYIAAVKEDKELLLYRPYNVDYYYVRHILVPFSDAQKAEFAKGQGLSEQQRIARRNQLAESITSYAHKEGYDDIEGGEKSLADIRREINATMANNGGSLFAANRAFEELIYKYNTDPGIVSKANGYPMQYLPDSEEKSPNGMVEEFEKASAKAYEAYIEDEKQSYGQVFECTSDFGVHFVMLSYVLPTRDLGINSYTSVLERETVYEQFEDEILTAKQTNYFSTYVSGIRDSLKNQYGDKMTTYDKVWKELAEELQKTYTK